MVKVILGLKGSGKTKKLIDSINSAIKEETGSVVCIEKGNALTFDVDYRVRLINASEYDIGSYEFLKGFVSGLHAGNFDITHIFIDNLYKVTGKDDDSKAPAFLDKLAALSEQTGVNFTINVSAPVEEASEGLKKYF